MENSGATSVAVHHPVYKSCLESDFDSLTGTADRHTGGMLTMRRTSEDVPNLSEVGCGHSIWHECVTVGKM